jgi:hypothetical protein
MWVKWSAFVAALMLGLAVLHLPIGFYIGLRWVVTISALGVAYEEQGDHSGTNGWVAIMVVVAILFNPIAPIHLNSRTIWLPIDLAVGVLFLVYGVLALVRLRKA